MTTYASTQSARSAVRPPTRVRRDPYRRRARRHRLLADCLTVALATVASLPVAFWLADAGPSRMTSTVATLTQLGVVAGLVATALCALMMLLAARVPVIDHILGHDRALATHRALAGSTYMAIFLHAVLLVSGYAMSARQDVVAQVVEMWQTPDWMLAILGAGGLTLVGVTSFAAVKARLGHEVWHAIHLLTYASVLLSLPHQFTTGLLAEHPWQRWAWFLLWGGVLFCGLTFRVFVPLLDSARASLRVVAVEPAGADAVSITVEGRDVDALGVRAGQFLSWRFLTPSMVWHQHPFSVSAAPTAHRLRITVRALGRGTRALQDVKVGTRVMVEGPYGRFSDDARTTSDGLVLLGAGIGIAPIRAVLEGTQVPAGATTVVLRAHDPAELYLLDEITQLCQERGATLYLAVGPRARDGQTASWLPATWVGHSLATVAPHVLSSDVYVCGPQAWTDAVLNDARNVGVHPTRIHDERFSW